MVHRLSNAYPQQDPGLIHRCRHLVCHMGELSLKKRNRRYFEMQLVRNIRSKFDGFCIQGIRRLPGRMVIEFSDEHDEDLLRSKGSTLFGVANVLPAYVVGPSMEELAAIVPIALEGREFSSFAVRCVRAEKAFPRRSNDICREIGAQIQQASGARVDLTHPEMSFHIEILSHEILVGVTRTAGPAGLPVGVTGKVAVLLSAGIDSPVAAWRMLRRGCQVELLHFHSAPFTSAASQEKVVVLTQHLAQWHGPLRLAMIPFGDIQQEIVARCEEPLRVVLYRRMMVRIAEALARESGAAAIVTGDSLAQVASQTLSNISTIDAAATLPIFRPLLGMDKNEIIRTAREIGTYETSIEPHSDCCGFLEPRSPATRSRVRDVEQTETALQLDELVARGVAGVTWQTL